MFRHRSNQTVQNLSGKNLISPDITISVERTMILKNAKVQFALELMSTIQCAKEVFCSQYGVCK